MQIDIVSIFPDMFTSVCESSIISRACQKEIISINYHNIRDFSKDKHHKVDDAPYGGGAGMVMMAPPVIDAVRSLPRKKKSHCIFLSPQGSVFNQEKAQSLASFDQLILLCGRYEGIDQRAIDLVVDDEISIGDYILTGGELAAMVVLDATVRLLPGVLGNSESIQDESFSQGLLEYPHYTRPETFEGNAVPKVLLSGNHADINQWRHDQAKKRTQEKRPDLYTNYQAVHEVDCPKIISKVNSDK